jgi:uncharacterized protein (TIGR02246 family)
MKQLIVLGGVVMLLSGGWSMARLAAADAAAEKEIRAVEQQMHDAYAKGDQRLFASLYADDATFTYSGGKTVGKDERVKALTAPFKNLKDEIQNVRVWGGTAVVNDRTDYDAQATGQHVALQVLRVWLKRDGKWQVVAFQSTPIVPNP